MKIKEDGLQFFEMPQGLYIPFLCVHACLNENQEMYENHLNEVDRVYGAQLIYQILLK